jgi:predicted CXXCH cytochrome family protein
MVAVNGSPKSHEITEDNEKDTSNKTPVATIEFHEYLSLRMNNSCVYLTPVVQSDCNKCRNHHQPTIKAVLSENGGAVDAQES